MKRKVFWGAAIGLVALLVTGGLYASNMGFKLNYQLTGNVGPGLTNGINTIALPYNQQTNLVTAKDLIDDIVAGGCTVNFVAEYVKSVNGFPSYTGTTPANAFNLTAGQCYLVQVVNDCNYVIVGSHDPSLGVVLTGNVGPGLTNGINSYAVPYHTTDVSALDLINEINGAGGTVNFAAKYIKSVNGFPSYTGTTPANAFDLAPGECYLVQVVNDTTITPAHY